MSKSYNNSIYLSDDDDVVAEKIRTAVTDPQRVRRHDPGDPEVCPIFAYHRIYSSGEQKSRVEEGCRTAGIGCVECKRLLTDNIIEELKPYREKRRELTESPERLREVMDEGNMRARELAAGTMKEVRRAMHL